MKPPRISAPKAIEPAVEMLNRFLESKTSEGEEFTLGQTIKCSWMWFKVGVDDQEQSVILAPKTGVMPMEFVADCSDALNLVLTQRYVCDSFGVCCGSCDAAQSAIVIKDLADCEEVFMNRTEQEHGSVSGWFFGASDSKLDANDIKNLALKSLWELSCDHDEARDFFLLPSGWQVVLGERPVVLRDFKPVAARSGSYYAAKYKN